MDDFTLNQLLACWLRGDQSTDAAERDVSFEADHHTLDKTVHLFPHEHYPLIEQKLDCELRRPTLAKILLQGAYWKRMYLWAISWRLVKLLSA